MLLSTLLLNVYNYSLAAEVLIDFPCNHVPPYCASIWHETLSLGLVSCYLPDSCGAQTDSVVLSGGVFSSYTLCVRRRKPNLVSARYISMSSYASLAFPSTYKLSDLSHLLPMYVLKDDRGYTVLSKMYPDYCNGTLKFCGDHNATISTYPAHLLSTRTYPDLVGAINSIPYHINVERVRDSTKRVLLPYCPNGNFHYVLHANSAFNFTLTCGGENTSRALSFVCDPRHCDSSIGFSTPVVNQSLSFVRVDHTLSINSKRLGKSFGICVLVSTSIVDDGPPLFNCVPSMPFHTPDKLSYNSDFYYDRKPMRLDTDFHCAYDLQVYDDLFNLMNWLQVILFTLVNLFALILSGLVTIIIQLFGSLELAFEQLVEVVLVAIFRLINVLVKFILRAENTSGIVIKLLAALVFYFRTRSTVASVVLLVALLPLTVPVRNPTDLV